MGGFKEPLPTHNNPLQVASLCCVWPPPGSMPTATNATMRRRRSSAARNESSPAASAMPSAGARCRGAGPSGDSSGACPAAAPDRLRLRGGGCSQGRGSPGAAAAQAAADPACSSCCCCSACCCGSPPAPPRGGPQAGSLSVPSAVGSLAGLCSAAFTSVTSRASWLQEGPALVRGGTSDDCHEAGAPLPESPVAGRCCSITTTLVQPCTSRQRVAQVTAVMGTQ